MSPAGSLETFVITIDPENSARRLSAQTQLKAISWPFQFIEGYRADDPAAYDLYSPELNRRACKRPLSSGEIAAYASHRRALRTFLEGSADVALVLEDDFEIVEPALFGRRIRDLLACPIQWSILKLFDFSPRAVLEAREIGDISIVNYVAPTAGMVGYLITRAGAINTLRRRKIFRPIDEDTKYYWELSLRVYSVQPNLVAEISPVLGGSHIADERRTIQDAKTLKRSIKGNFLTLHRKIWNWRFRRLTRFSPPPHAEAGHSRRPA